MEYAPTADTFERDLTATFGADSAPWWQQDREYTIDELTDEMIDDAPGWGDLYEA
jgi:hypothetical protein